MLIDRYAIGEALPVDVRTMGELMEAGAEAPVGVFYCVDGQKIAAAHPDEVMSSDLLSDFIFGEYLSQAGVGVAGDLAAMEQTARNCVSQGATDRELTEYLAL